MYDLRPVLAINGYIHKEYKSKKSNKYLTSKLVYSEVEEGGSDSCRETLCHYIGDKIVSLTYNSKVTSNPYRIKPLIYVKKKGKIYGNSSNIELIPSGSIRSDSVLNQLNKSKRDIITKFMHYMLGITATALSHDPLEEKRMRTGKYSVTCDISHCSVSYEGLSNFWLVSPVIVSIVMGVARNAYDMAIHHILNDNKSYSDILKCYDYDRVKDIIDTHNTERAIRVFNEYIRPTCIKYYDQHRYSQNSTFILGRHDTSNAVSKFVNNGVYHYFNPNKTYNYWHDFDMHYGLLDFISEFGPTGKRWKIELERTVE
jgi:hypothetical protein